MKTNGIVSLFLISLTFTTSAFADNVNEKNSIEFFASNNTKEIDLQTAFNRLKGNDQNELRNSTINLMQQKHIEQGKFADLLGTYQMSSDKNVTADNSEIFITSPNQKIPNEKAFNLAKDLANSLNQESVAVFIPTKQPTIGEISINFKSHSYSINELIKTVHEKLPQVYNQAFSIYLNDSCGNFDNVTVKEIEWLGSKIKPDEIKNAFPQEEISQHYGKAYLVYKNGQKEPL